MSTETNTETEFESNADLFGFADIQSAIELSGKQDSDEKEAKEERGTGSETESEEQGQESTDESEKSDTGKPDSDEDGESAEEDSKEGQPEDESGFGELIQSLVDDDILSGDKEEYELSEDGLKELIAETKQKAKVAGVTEFKDTLGEKEKEIVNLLEKGASAEDVMQVNQEVDYEKVPLYDKDGDPIESHVRQLVIDLLVKQGDDQEEITEKIADYEEKGLLEKEAKRAHTKLVKLQKTERKEKEERIVKQREESIKQQEREIQEFKERVTNIKEIKGFQITKKDAEKLHEYVTIPVNDKGQTQFELDNNEETQLLFAHFAMNKFDKKKLEREAVTKKAIKLKKNLSKTNDNTANSKKSTPPKKESKTVDFSEVSWL